MSAAPGEECKVPGAAEVPQVENRRVQKTSRDSSVPVYVCVVSVGIRVFM